MFQIHFRWMYFPLADLYGKIVKWRKSKYNWELLHYDIGTETRCTYNACYLHSKMMEIHTYKLTHVGTHTHRHTQKIVKSQRNIFYVALNANKTDMLKLYL